MNGAIRWTESDKLRQFRMHIHRRMKFIEEYETYHNNSSPWLVVASKAPLDSPVRSRDPSCVACQASIVQALIKLRDKPFKVVIDQLNCVSKIDRRRLSLR